MNFIGIDLAWKKDGETAIVVLNSKGKVIAHGWEDKDSEIASFAERYSEKGCLVGIDAPLVVNNAVGRRKCEDELQSRGMPAYPANRSWFIRAFGTIRGEALVAELEKRGIQLIGSLPMGGCIRGVMEVYPYATLKMILPSIPAYKKGRKSERCRGLVRLTSMLGNLSPPVHVPLEVLENETMQSLKRASDFVDAAVAAYTVYLCFKNPNRCLILGDKKEGFVLLPRKS